VIRQIPHLNIFGVIDSIGNSKSRERASQKTGGYLASVKG
jgi:hypothetical protein